MIASIVTSLVAAAAAQAVSRGPRPFATGEYLRLVVPTAERLTLAAVANPVTHEGELLDREVRKHASAAQQVDRYEPSPAELAVWMEDPWEPPPSWRWELPRRAK